MSGHLGFVYLLAAALPALSQVTVTDGLSYSNLSPVRLFRMFYRAGTQNSAPLPIIVWIHGGGWSAGGRGDVKSTPSVCNGDETIACWLADHGYVVFPIDYTLVDRTASGSDLRVVAWHTVSAASHAFKTSDIGSTLNVVVNGGGWNPGGYHVISVKDGEALLDGAAGSIGAKKGGYALLNSSTLWPVQWQDCNCFLRFLAEQAGVSVPGDPQNIVLMGHSSGGHLAAITGFAGNNAFATNCEHTSVNYTIKGIVSSSPPTDLITAYAESGSIKSSVRNLLGCTPGYGTCNTVAASASITTYVAGNLPPYMSFSGAGDTTVVPANVREAQTAFANLKPPVAQQWILFGPAFSHPLDVFFYSECAAGNEPSPCGSAGSTFQAALPFIQSVTAH
jgi:acetyl esterase/lipase